MIRVIAFDVFGTLVDMSGVDRSDLKAYAAHLRTCRETGTWSPLNLPGSWRFRPAHPDSADGITLLRRKFKVVTCSNAPLELQDALLSHNGIDVDAIVPIEANRAFKPNPLAYRTVCQVVRCNPEDVLMVTANSRRTEDFNDLEGAKDVGMDSILIRGEEVPTVIDLARRLGVV